MTWTFLPGVVETRDPAFEVGEVAQVPVEAIRIIYTAGEAPFTKAAAHIQELLDHGKYPITTLKVPDWRTAPMADWTANVKQFVANVPSAVIEVGNEPWPAQRAAYWPKLKAASPIIRAAGKKVILAGQPPEWADDFYAEAHNAEAYPFVDGIGLHPYIGDVTRQLQFVKGRRAKLDGYGARQPLWFTEFGWGSAGTASYAARYMLVDEATQAKNIAVAFANFKREAEKDRYKAGCLFSWRDWRGSTNWDHHCGVRRLDGSFKPSYESLKAL